MSRKDKKEWTLETLLSVVGFLFELLRVVVNALRARNGTVDDLRRLIREPKLVDDVFDLIVGAKKLIGFQVTYDQAKGLTELIRRALGPKNVNNFNHDMMPSRFPLKGRNVRTVNVRVEPFLSGETGEEAAKRLTATGHTLANTGDLVGFLHEHPKEVENWSWVISLSGDSRWKDPNGYILVPCARVNGAYRFFRLDDFDEIFGFDRGVLVLCE